MNRIQFVALLSILIAGLLILSNPNEEAHKATAKAKLQTILKTGTATNPTSANLVGLLSNGVNSLLEGYVVDQLVTNVTRKNYMICSTTIYRSGDQDYVIGMGVLGNVFLSAKIEERINAILNKKGETVLTNPETNGATSQPATGSKSDMRTGLYQVANDNSGKIHFYKDPNSRQIKKAFLLPNQEVFVEKTESDFAYAEYYNNKTFKVTRGWLPAKSLSLLEAATPDRDAPESRFIYRDKYYSEQEGSVTRLYVNEEFVKNITEEERAVLAFIGAYICSDCANNSSDPNERSAYEYNEGGGFRCVVSNALDLGENCSKEHYDLIKKWFSNAHNQTRYPNLIGYIDQNYTGIRPMTASVGNNLNYINLKRAGNTIYLIYGHNYWGRDYRGVNQREVSVFNVEQNTINVLKLGEQLANMLQ